jgi:hypothetical protein
MPMDRETQLRLVNLRDETGVLSLYINADPRQESSQPPWMRRLDNGLKQLLDVTDEPLRSTLAQRLRRMEMQIEQFVRPGEPGIGRAMFVPLSDGEDFTIAMQTPLTDRIALGPRSHIAPMFAAWAEGSPTGIAVVDGRGMRILDSRFGLCEELSRLEFELDTAEWREMQGPTPQRGAWGRREGHSTVSQTDLFDYKIAEHLSRFLAAAHRTLETHVKDYGWEFLAVSGEPELVEAAAKALDRSLKASVVPSQRVLGHATPPQVLELLADDLAVARRGRDETLARAFGEAALKAAPGSEAVLKALQEGRVERLLLESDSKWSGRRIPAGSVLTDGLVPGDPDTATAVAEAQLGEQMIEMALAQDATVSILSGDVRMQEHAGGVGAMLRW